MKNNECGAINILMLTTIIFGILAVGLGVGFGWAFMGKNDAVSNLDTAVEEAKYEQRQISERDCEAEIARPFATFTGPSDFGSVTFEYPRTWSSYVDDSGITSGNMRYFFHPNSVPTINDATIYALRLSVESRRYEDVLRGFESQIQNGNLVASPVTINEHQGMRISGTFSQTVGDGTMVIFRIRDRTLILRTDSADFLNYFDDIILNSLRYSE